MDNIRDNIIGIHEKIKDVCDRVGRNPEEITLIAVTKTIDTDRINHAIDCGMGHIGENKVQEVTSKYEFVTKNVSWHLIGHLQSNKVKYIIDKVDLIHSVDSLSLAQEIEKRAAKLDITKDILIQVNIAKEGTKSGIYAEELDDLINDISKLNHIRIKGLMTIGPLSDDIEETRTVFRALKQKFDELSKAQIPNAEMKYLSMGMTNDYEMAIEEGSNMIRVGTGIFGKRNYNK